MTDTTRYHLFDTALGLCGVAWNSRGLVGVQLPEKDRDATVRRLAAKSQGTPAEPVAWVAALIEDIRKYCAGEQIDFSAIAVDLDGIDDFRQKLYAELRQVSFGRTVTYGELAKRLGLPGWEGARDVGEAIGRNPMPIVIPCHRVLAAGNKAGGFSAYGGTTTKRKLLALEGVELSTPKKATKPDESKQDTPRLPGL
jgi:methylated-DNA-[protein]-cysteine S-methyltransferase